MVVLPLTAIGLVAAEAMVALGVLDGRDSTDVAVVLGAAGAAGVARWVGALAFPDERHRTGRAARARSRESPQLDGTKGHIAASRRSVYCTTDGRGGGRSRQWARSGRHTPHAVGGRVARPDHPRRPPRGSTMTCTRCDTVPPDGAAFCHSCGTHLDRTDWRAGSGGPRGHSSARRHAFAAHPGEPVVSFDIVSSLMPLASGTAPRTYRIALLVGVAITTLFAVVGWLPSAFVAAALVVPVVYLVYLYDVNEWEDEPIPVVLGSILLAAALAVGFTLLWSEVVLGDRAGQRNDAWPIDTLLVGCLAVPVVAELLRQIGPVLLSRMPTFDDLIDSVTFGVATGAAWAAAETLVLNRAMITGPSSVDGDTALWWMLLVTVGIVKPIVYGSATALAVAGFSGIGEGYDGLTRRYAFALTEAIAYGIVFQLGLYLGDRVGGQMGAVVGLAIGIAVALVVIVRVRLVLHQGLLEAALEAARTQQLTKHAASGEAWCGHCEMPLLPGAAFCSACGMAVRATGKQRRASNAHPGTADPDTTHPTSTGAGTALLVTTEGN
jgi:hypothetical protein